MKVNIMINNSGTLHNHYNVTKIKFALLPVFIPSKKSRFKCMLFQTHNAVKSERDYFHIFNSLSLMLNFSEIIDDRDSHHN